MTAVAREEEIQPQASFLKLCMKPDGLGGTQRSCFLNISMARKATPVVMAESAMLNDGQR